MKILSIIFLLSICLYTYGQKIDDATRLDLSNHNLKTIPDTVFQKTNLIYLNLGTGLTIYPPLSALVDSNENRITEIPGKIGNLVNLKILLLQVNKFTTLPDSIIQLRNLEVLDLSFNSNLKIIQQLDKIKLLPNLKVLKITLTNVEDDDLNIIKTTLPNVKIIFSLQEYANSLR